MANVNCKKHGIKKAFKLDTKSYCVACIEEKVFMPRMEDYEEVI